MHQRSAVALMLELGVDEHADDFTIDERTGPDDFAIVFYDHHVTVTTALHDLAFGVEALEEPDCPRLENI
jgi:hypothetical protein